MTVNHDVAGSNPASGASGLFVKRLRHRPFTAGSGVRIPHRSPWAISSAGRASALQAECQQFDPVIAHQKKASRDPLRGAFFFPFFFFLYSHITSCIRDSLHFVRHFAPSKCVRCGTSSILFSLTKRKHHVIRSVVLFSFLFPFSLQSYNLLHPRLTTFCASLCSFKMCSLRNQFDPVFTHQKKASRDPLPWCFFLSFFLFLYGHVTSCIRDSLHFVRRFAPSKCVRCGTSSILLSPTIMKSPTCSAPWDFLLPFPFSLICHSPCP